jgi:hypothetical protein
MSPASDLVEGAERAVKILESWNGVADRFARQWAGFNAIYNAFSGSERGRLMKAIESGLTIEQAQAILNTAAASIKFFTALPPGDMRVASSDRRFRARTEEDMRAVNDATLSPSARLAYLLSVVYQIRCNLLHGEKNVADARDERLVREGEVIVATAVEALIANAGSRRTRGVDSHV